MWSHSLASDIATIDGTTLRFLKHYEGPVTITATTGEYSDVKVINVDCGAIPDEVIYSVVTPPSTPTVEWDATSAELSFVGKITAKYNDGHKPDEVVTSTYNFTAEFPQNPLIYPEVNTEMVDLGLPSGTKWAKCNLFAQTETDYGYYFQWGDTQGYPIPTTIDREGAYNWEGHDVAWIVKQKTVTKIFDWSTYKYCEGTEDTITKYNQTDNKGSLDIEDDAVAYFMGDGWRIPSEALCRELRENTDNEWVDNYNNTGCNGRLFKSRVNDNELFMPGSGQYGIFLIALNDLSVIWTSNIVNINYPKSAWNMFNQKTNPHSGGYSRANGYNLRGVHA